MTRDELKAKLQAMVDHADYSRRAFDADFWTSFVEKPIGEVLDEFDRLTAERNALCEESNDLAGVLGCVGAELLGVNIWDEDGNVCDAAPDILAESVAALRTRAEDAELVAWAIGEGRLQVLAATDPQKCVLAVLFMGTDERYRCDRNPLAYSMPVLTSAAREALCKAKEASL